MKIRLSLSLCQENLEKIDARIREGTFRNRSHAIEFAIRQATGATGGKHDGS